MGTAGPWLLLFLCGLACGDRVVVARGLSLVSAAQSSDAGFGALEFDGPEPEAADAGVDAVDAAQEKPFDFGQEGPGRKPLPPPSSAPPRADGHGDPHDKQPDKESKLEKSERAGEAGGDPDAGQASHL